MARYGAQLLAPAEGFDLWQMDFLHDGHKKFFFIPSSHPVFSGTNSTLKEYKNPKIWKILKQSKKMKQKPNVQKLENLRRKNPDKLQKSFVSKHLKMLNSF